MRNRYFTFAFMATEASLVPTPLLERCLDLFAGLKRLAIMRPLNGRVISLSKAYTEP